MHLSNYSLNKKSSKYVAANDDPTGGMGNKRALSAVMKRWQKDGIDTDELWRRMRKLVSLTVQSMRLVQTSPKFRQIRV